MANDSEILSRASEISARTGGHLSVVYSVQLLVDRGKGKGKANGWETVEVGNNFYRYHFTGGNDGGGRIRVQNGSEIQVHIELLQRQGDTYTIDEVECLVDPNSQLKARKDTDTRWIIDDRNDKPQQGYYLVKVRSSEGDIIDCDPMITNEPK